MIYICIPTYNEARTIGVLLWKIRQVMTEFPRDYQILVLDDASTDSTPEVLEPYTRILPLTVVRNEERRGYAASLEVLLRGAVRRSRYPKRDAVVTLQADFTDEPGEIPTLVKRIEGGADVVTSAVELDREDAPRVVRWGRGALNFVLRRRRWPEEVTDPLSGFRAYRVIALKKLLASRNGNPLLEWEGWAANVELLQHVLPFARRVDEAQVTARYDRRNRPTRIEPWEESRRWFQFLRSSPATVEEVGAAVRRRGRRQGGAEPRTEGDDAGTERPQQRRRRGSGGRGRGGSGGGSREGRAEAGTAQGDDAAGEESGSAHESRSQRNSGGDGNRGGNGGPRRRRSGRRGGRRRGGRTSGAAQGKGREQRSDEGSTDNS